MAMTIKSQLTPMLSDFQRRCETLAERRGVVAESMGRFLLHQQRLHFGQLVRTGSSNGVTWPSPAVSTLAQRRSLARRGLLPNVSPEMIGIRTGKLSQSFRFRANSNGVRLVNIDPKSGTFSKRRPLYPPFLPPAWLAGCESIAQKTLEKNFDGLGSPQ